MLRDIIRIFHKDHPSDYIIRKSELILYLILFIWLCAFILLLSFLLWASSIFIELQTNTLFGQALWWTIGIILIVTQLCIWWFFIERLVKYFYSFCIINATNVIVINFNLFFKEKVEIAELYRVLTIRSSQTWFLELLLNFWDITLLVQNDTFIRIENVSRPKLIVNKLESLKEYALEQRFSWDEEAQESGDWVTEKQIVSESKNESAGLQESSKENTKNEVKEYKEHTWDDQRKPEKDISQISTDDQLREEIKEELKQEIKDEIKQEIKNEMKDEKEIVANNDSTTSTQQIPDTNLLNEKRKQEILEEMKQATSE